MADIKKEEGTVTNLKSRVKVTATAKHPFAEKGQTFEVHPTVAESFLKKGFIDKYKSADSE